MREGICLAIIIAIVAIAFAATSKSESATLPLSLGHKIETIRGHDYLIVWNGDRSCCVIHAESCPCRSMTEEKTRQ